MTSAPANWYPDPNDAAQWRYWDGTMWTDLRAPRDADATSNSPGAIVKAAPTAMATVVSGIADGFFGRRKSKSLMDDREPSIEKLLGGLQREAPRHPLEEQVEVAGETYHVKGIKRVFADRSIPISAKGSTLEELECILVPEPWNPHDGNAVAVVVGSHQVGHLPADLACDYAAPLGRLAVAGFLATGEARIWAKSEGGMVRARVTLLIPEAHRCG